MGFKLKLKERQAIEVCKQYGSLKRIGIQLWSYPQSAITGIPSVNFGNTPIYNLVEMDIFQVIDRKESKFLSSSKTYGFLKEVSLVHNYEEVICEYEQGKRTYVKESEDQKDSDLLCSYCNPQLNPLHDAEKSQIKSDLYREEKDKMFITPNIIRRKIRSTHGN
jgi:hypothetical protein